MAESLAELRRPLPLLLLVLAVAGWIIAAWSLIDGRAERTRLTDDAAAARRQSDLVAAELRTERAAVGSLAEVEGRRSATLAQIGEAQTQQRAAEAARDEAQARFRSTSADLQQLSIQQGSLRQAVAQVNADLEKAHADFEGTVRQDAAVKLQSAQAANELTAARQQLNDTRSARVDAEAMLAAAKSDTAAATRTTEKLKEDASAEQNRLDVAQAALADVETRRRALDKAVEAQIRARDTLNAEVSGLAASVAKAQTEEAAARQRGDEARDAKATADAELAKLDQAIAARRAELGSLDSAPATPR